MHRLSILLLVAAVTLSLTLPTFAMEDSNEELELASQYLSSRGIMVGDGEGNMNFDGPLTRAHLATRIFYDEYGRSYRGVDAELKQRIQDKLAARIMERFSLE